MVQAPISGSSLLFSFAFSRVTELSFRTIHFSDQPDGALDFPGFLQLMQWPGDRAATRRLRGPFATFGVLVKVDRFSQLGSIYQGKPFWGYPMFDPICFFYMVVSAFLFCFS